MLQCLPLDKTPNFISVKVNLSKCSKINIPSDSRIVLSVMTHSTSAQTSRRRNVIAMSGGWVSSRVICIKTFF